MSEDETKPSEQKTKPENEVPKREPTLLELYELVASVRAVLESRLDGLEAKIQSVDDHVGIRFGALEREVDKLKHVYGNLSIEVTDLLRRVTALETGDLGQQIAQLLAAARLLAPSLFEPRDSERPTPSSRSE